MYYEENKVSVVLCTYNGSAFLEKQLNSILEQTYDINEIIIVDDCSSDNTKEILKMFQDKNRNIKLFFNDVNLGSNKSFKLAISLATNNYIALCDQDDIWFRNKIEIQMNAINLKSHDDGKPLVCFHDLRLIDQNDIVTNNSFWKLHKFVPKKFTFRKLLIVNIITGCTCIINRCMKEEMLKSDMEHIIMHDYLLALIGYGFGNVVYIEEPLMYYRSHTGTVTEKEKITFGNRIKSFISRVNDGNYLLPYILQIEKVNYLYGDKFDLQRKKLVDSFIGLKNKGLLNRMIYKWLLN
ncbi:glycosyltransferase family 2 protein [Flavobacterium humidisoli]|uniref:Glycosyltransferase family 2 protein n=1 Tax=Flavobacterium humidisoli TaxID=2937442 RepID=A0ABY4LSK3_9FLAO|nr:glycosyltransferase family 2 protein [Flavobacterium humidisoli]UPZ16065.1 glycosyltransferase family 2 protein [Flavobacterium humidisoli]